MSLPRIATKDEWLAARGELLAREKEFNRQRDSLSAARRNLPMVRIEKNYLFEGARGPARLADLFAGQRQLIVYHFMFDPSWSEGCKNCSCVVDGMAGSIVHLAARDTAFAAVSYAPFDKSEAFRRRMGWDVPWFSSFGSEFNHDFAVLFTADEIARGDAFYNYRTRQAGGQHMPGLSVFLTDPDGAIYHTYSTYARGLDLFINMYNLLDATPLGRQEVAGQKFAWVRHHDKYPAPTAIR